MRTTRPSPERVARRLAALAANLFWTWDAESVRLFRWADPEVWERTGHDPPAVLRGLPRERLRELANDRRFLELLLSRETALRCHLRGPTWFGRNAHGKARRRRVAYFCAEYGIHESLPIYSGGLGVLAGDHLKSASDLGIPVVGVGLLYRGGFYRQELRPEGSTRVIRPRLDPERLPIEDTGVAVPVPLAGRTVHARVWRVHVGRVPLLLLDTDVPRNRPRDRAITRHLYGGDAGCRIRQELVLGVGGYRALEALGYRANRFHLNEGHAAFCALERLRALRRGGRSLARAVERVRRASIFTTHTPVAAGHDRFRPALAARYLEPLAQEMGMASQEILAFGRVNGSNLREPFCMTVLAFRLSGSAYAVSRRHGEVTRAMWRRLFGVRDPDLVPVDHVTNGVHPATWVAPEMAPIFFGTEDPSRWHGTGAERFPGEKVVDPEEFWARRCAARRRLVTEVRRRLAIQVARRGGSAKEIAAAGAILDDRALTIGFARRFATYKRTGLLFRDPERLERILRNQARPAQIVLAGKAHPADAAGLALVRRIYRLASSCRFRDRVVFLEDYEMALARLMAAGCDVWLNTPLRPYEASGTSGMKAAMNGAIHLSVPDGWWAEGYDGRNGWVIGSGEAEPRRTQDAEDAASLYRLLEREVTPLFYRRDRRGIPRGWVKMALRSMATSRRFTSHRMMEEAMSRFFY